MVKEIELTQGLVAIVDDEDYQRLIDMGPWNASKGTNTYYARRIETRPIRKTIRMHRLILGIDDSSIQVDHINGDGLLNIKDNLRICTHQQNNYNQQKQKGKHSSIYKGVCWRCDCLKWRARITIDNHRTTIGHYDSEEEAAIAYDSMARSLYGEYARLNFPESSDINKKSAQYHNNYKTQNRIYSSNYRGVYWHKNSNSWRVNICKDYKTIHLGYYSDEISAALAYDIKAKELYGEFAKLNFPDE